MAPQATVPRIMPPGTLGREQVVLSKGFDGLEVPRFRPCFLGAALDACTPCYSAASMKFPHRCGRKPLRPSLSRSLP